MTDIATTNNEELKTRILERKTALEAKLAGCCGETTTASDESKTTDLKVSIQKDLDTLGPQISNGWENLNTAEVQGLNDWYTLTATHVN